MKILRFYTRLLLSLLVVGISFASFAENDETFFGFNLATDEEIFANQLEQAKKGNVDAMLTVGLYYYQGKGVKQNYGSAVSWWATATRFKGNSAAIAMNNLGCCYRDGLGVRKDLSSAKMWFEKSIANGYDEAKQGLDEVNAALAEEKALKEKRENDCIRRENEQKRQARARKEQMENDYQNGHALRINRRYDEALPLLRRAAEGGHAYAMYDLGVAYINGQGCNLNITGSAKWFIKAAEAGVKAAYHYAGTAYANGVGCDKDFSKARHWYMKGIYEGDWLCEQYYGDLQRGIIRPYYVPSASATSGSTSNSSVAHSAAKQQEVPQTRTVPCTRCNGTGMLTGREKFRQRYDGECGALSCSGEHVFINCKVCGKYHCSHIDNHYHCDKCGGTGKIQQVKKYGHWVDDVANH